MTHETSESIYQWQRATFGEYNSHFRQASRALTEMAELMDAVSSGNSREKIIEECADIAIVMYGYIEAAQVSINKPQLAQLQYKNPVESAALASCELSRILLKLSDGYNTSETTTETWWLYYSLQEICESLQGNLQDAVDAKMQINRARQWVYDGTSHSGHVKLKEELPVDFSTIV